MLIDAAGHRQAPAVFTAQLYYIHARGWLHGQDAGEPALQQRVDDRIDISIGILLEDARPSRREEIPDALVVRPEVLPDLCRANERSGFPREILVDGELIDGHLLADALQDAESGIAERGEDILHQLRLLVVGQAGDLFAHQRAGDIEGTGDTRDHERALRPCLRDIRHRIGVDPRLMEGEHRLHLQPVVHRFHRIVEGERDRGIALDQLHRTPEGVALDQLALVLLQDHGG